MLKDRRSLTAGEKSVGASYGYIRNVNVSDFSASVHPPLPNAFSLRAVGWEMNGKHKFILKHGQLPPLCSLSKHDFPAQSLIARRKNCCKQTLERGTLCRGRSELRDWFTVVGKRDAYDAIETTAFPDDGIMSVRWTQDRFLVVIPVLHILVDGLPSNVAFSDLVAWMHPSTVAKRYYFNAFGSICRTDPLPERIIETELSEQVVQRRLVRTMLCTPLWKEIGAARRIQKWYKRVIETGSGSKEQSIETFYRQRIQSSSTGRRSRSKSFDDAERSNGGCSNAYVESVVQQFLEGVPLNRAVPRAVLMFGVPASGKTTLLKQRRKKDHVIIDVDECLACMPSFWNGVFEHQGKSGSDDDWVFDLRVEARRIAESILDRAIELRTHIVWNGTGRSPFYYETLIRRLRLANYKIEACGVHIRSNTARQRMKAREAKFKRPVPKHILQAAIQTVQPSFNRVSLQSDWARVWSMEGPSSPSIVWDHDHGIVDTDRWLQWTAPSPLHSSRDD